MHLQDIEEDIVPISKYFKGKGKKVMKSMKKQYGEEKGERVFYATANKAKKKGKKGKKSRSGARWT